MARQGDGSSTEVTALGRMGDFGPSDTRRTGAAERAEAGVRPTGAELFAAKSQAEQDEMLGADAAELVRSGEVALADLVEESPLEQGQDFITQRPVAAL